MLIKTVLVSFVIFAVIPFLGVNFLPPDWGFLFLLLTLYILNPLFLLYIGVWVGKNIKDVWFHPLLALLIFAISTRLIYGTLDLFLLGINIVACGMAILATCLWRKRNISK